MRSRDWGPWLVALGGGIAVGWWLGRQTAPAALVDDEVVAVGMAAEGLRLVDRRLRRPAPVADRRLADALGALDGARRLRAHALGAGVVDLTGEADAETAEVARAALEAVPGVEVVVNRVWTPASAAPGLNGRPYRLGIT